MLGIILAAIWFILPAYFANSAPVLVGKLLGNYNIPFNKKLFGAGKTIPGFIGGVLVGTLVGYLQGVIVLGLLLGLGAVTGDLVKSFFKRRLGKKRGAPWPPFDQLDFIIGALLFASLVIRIPWAHIVTLLILTPAFHFTANVVAWKLKLKKEWW